MAGQVRLGLGDVWVELGADVAGVLQFGVPFGVVSQQVSVGVFVVLAEVAGWCSELVGEQAGAPHGAGIEIVSCVRVVQRLEETPVGEVGVCQEIGIFIYRAGGYTGKLELGHEVVRIPVPGPPRD